MNDALIDKTSYTLSVIVFLLSWSLFAWEAGSILQTFFAALLTGALFWVSYTLVRWLILAIKR